MYKVLEEKLCKMYKIYNSARPGRRRAVEKEKDRLFYDAVGTLDGSVCKLAELVGVLQGLPRSPQSLVIRMPTATPHLLYLVRGGSTLCRGLYGFVPRVPFDWGVPLSTYIV